MTNNKRHAKASSTETLPEATPETMPEVVSPIETQLASTATLTEPETTEPETTEPETTEPPETAVSFPSLRELQAMPIVDQLASDWLVNNLQLAVALRVRQLLNSDNPADQCRLRELFETFTLSLAAGALHHGLQQAIAASKQSLQTLSASPDA